MHLVGLAGLCTDIAFLQGAATYGRLRTAVINAQMRVCGSRFGRGWLRPGGVVATITSELRNDLTSTLQAFLRDLAQVNELVLGARSVRARFQGIGVVSRLAAHEVGLVGPAARASGVELDTRTQLRGRCWRAFPVAAQVEQSGDCWARLRLRMTEIAESARWLCALLDNAELAFEAGKPALLGQVRANALSVSVVEGFRGEVIHVLETDQRGDLLHYKVQDPSLQNWFGLALALRGTEISDFPICNKSFDLSYCGNDL
jgi:Ni,Fe-hydrogenase III large subunit